MEWLPYLFGGDVGGGEGLSASGQLSPCYAFGAHRYGEVPELAERA